MIYPWIHTSMRRILVSLVTMSSWVCTAPITLDSPLIHYVDGIFINGRRICDIRKLQLEIGFLAIGKKTRENTREPLYGWYVLESGNQIFVLCCDDEKSELYRIEEQTRQSIMCGHCDNQHVQDLSKSLQDIKLITFDTVSECCVATHLDHCDLNVLVNSSIWPRHSLHSLATLERSLMQQASSNDYYRPIVRDALTVMLGFMKRDFEKKSAKFIDDASLFKKAMVGLIQESCTKRGREDSLLLGWAKSEKGHEMEHFNQSVVTFKDFYVFSGDLISFLGDLMHSCPKAMKQFKELMEHQ